jgi:hypothetical protein
MRPLRLDVPEEALDPRLVGGSVRAAEALGDGHERQQARLDSQPPDQVLERSAVGLDLATELGQEGVPSFLEQALS